MGSGISSLDTNINKEAAQVLFGDDFNDNIFNELSFVNVNVNTEGEFENAEKYITKDQIMEYLNKNIKNSALLFIKPHAYNEKTKNLVYKKLIDAGCKIISENVITGIEIDEKKLIDNHYYAIASKATILKPSELVIPEDKFESFFNEKWSTVLAEDRAVNALDACSRLDITSAELETAWRECEPKKKVVKFGGGFYCGLIEMEGKPPLYVFNAFFMKMRSKFVGTENSIYYYSIEWDQSKMPWSFFRQNLIGSTDPLIASPDSIRGMISNQWKELGLSGPCSTGDNGIHASASPYEGLVEKMNWLGRPISEESFGIGLIRNGVAEDTIKSWSTDPRVNLPPSDDTGIVEQGSIFDHLEELDASQCLAKCIAIDDVNK